MRLKTSVRRRRGVPTGILVALIALTGCGAVDAGIPATSAGISLAPGTDVFTLSVGDCVNTATGDLRSGVSLVPCADDHDWEIYFEAGVPGTGPSGEDYPGDEVLMAAAEADCGAQFGSFLGLDPAAAADTGSGTDALSELGYTYLIPSETDWRAQAEHEVTCLIGDMGGPVTGSLAGAAG
ncbi:hypothetical protein E3T61_13345 [Cryobacterium lactosi]|uniref:Septum formation-related domain-containing protein n=1 Tax=Cryobacterium lactosi TaxID=1259202 RepID=A0A4R9BNT1_9MICO|nr:hypothetical protein [Cryobacterium lactosi]TFD88086.1 hypothetical protein E3T61_13345 [Cryobacterium lactosi]